MIRGERSQGRALSEVGEGLCVTGRRIGIRRRPPFPRSYSATAKGGAHAGCDHSTSSDTSTQTAPAYGNAVSVLRATGSAVRNVRSCVIESQRKTASTASPRPATASTMGVKSGPLHPTKLKPSVSDTPWASRIGGPDTHDGGTGHDDGHLVGDGHNGVGAHDDGHVMESAGHHGATAHDDAHVVGDGHAGGTAHDDAHIVGDGHDGTGAHDDAHVVGDGHDGSTNHDDGHTVGVDGHDGTVFHDDAHIVGDGHDGATGHDDAHIVGDGHDRSTTHDDAHIVGDGHDGAMAHDDADNVYYVGHNGAWAHDDDHVIGDGHDGTTAHDDAHIVGDGHDGATGHDDAHSSWPAAFDEVSAGGEFRVWMEDSMPVAEPMLGLEDQILAVWVWFDWGWVPYSSQLAGFDQIDFALWPGAILFIVPA